MVSREYFTSGHGSFDAQKGLNLPQTLRNSSTDVSSLKEAIVKLEAEKEAGLVEFYKILKKVSCLESQVVSAEEKARKAEDEVGSLNKEIVKMQEEKEVLSNEKNVLLENIRSLEKEKISLVASNLYLNEALRKVRSEMVTMEECYDTIVGEKLALEFELSALVILFEELKMETTKAETEREVHVEKLKNEVETVNMKYAKLQELYQNLQMENSLLGYEVELRKVLVHERDLQLLEAEKSLTTMHTEKVHLENLIEVMKSDASRDLTVDQSSNYADSEKLEDLMFEDMCSGGYEKKHESGIAKFGSRLLLKGRRMHRRVGSEMLLDRSQSKRKSFLSCIHPSKWDINPSKKYDRI